MIIVSTTSDSELILKQIASIILDKKLSPCTHIYKIDYSGYIWNNEIVHKEEFKKEIKTILSNQSAIKSIIKNNHNYNVYELTSLEIKSLNSDYDNWFKNQIA